MRCFWSCLQPTAREPCWFPDKNLQDTLDLNRTPARRLSQDWQKETGPQLRVNLEHALAAGATRRELFEVILQMSVYGGMPAAINGMNVAMQLFEDQDAQMS